MRIWQVVEIAHDSSVVSLPSALQRCQVLLGSIEHSEENLLECECFLLVFTARHVLKILEEDVSHVVDVEASWKDWL